MNTRDRGALAVEDAVTDDSGAALGAVPVRIGDLIGDRYLIRECIAAGGMGLVFGAIHVDLDRPVALKCMRTQFATDPEIVERFLNEARAAARLRNNHVAQVLDFGRTKTGAPYMVMERLEGADLGSILIQRGSLPLEEAVDYVLQACSALAEAHAHGIVHRDIKPENLFLTHAGDDKPVIKVLDFGISKQLAKAGRALTNPSRSIGSPYYMSPEQIRNARSVDARTDIWSMGVVLFELITGELPFDAELVPEVYAHVLCDAPRGLCELRPELPPELDAIVRRCLHKDRESRFSSIEELASALELFTTPPTLPVRKTIESAASLPPPVYSSAVGSRRPRKRRASSQVFWVSAALALAGFAGARCFGYDPTRALRDIAIEPALAADAVELPADRGELELVPVLPILNDGSAVTELEAPAPTPVRAKRPKAMVEERSSNIAESGGETPPAFEAAPTPGF